MCLCNNIRQSLPQYTSMVGFRYMVKLVLRLIIAAAAAATVTVTVTEIIIPIHNTML